MINKHLDNQFIEWVIVGAFGDNLKTSAKSLSKNTSLSDSEIQLLVYLPTIIHLIFINDASEDYNKLEDGYLQDMNAAKTLEAKFTKDNVALLLPNETWARRVEGVFSNDLANKKTGLMYFIANMPQETVVLQRQEASMTYLPNN